MIGVQEHLRFWWRSRRPAVMAAVLSIVAAFIIVIVVASVVPQAKTSEPLTARPTCSTNDCLQMAQRLRDSMNESVDPCDDFYLFACQRWDSVRNISIWQTASNDIQDDVVYSREALINGQNQPTDKAERYFVDFMHHCQHDDAQRDPLLAELDRLGGYPLFGTKSSSYNWLKADALLAHILVNPAIFFVRIDIDPKLKDKRILRIGHQPSMFAVALLENDSAVKGMKDFIRSISITYRGVLGTATTNMLDDINNQIVALIRFAKDLNQVLEVRERVSMERVTIEKLCEIIPTVDWPLYLRALTSPVFNETTALQNIGPIYVQNRNTLLRLTAFLSQEQHQREVANYIGYKFIVNSVFFSPNTDVLQAYYNYTAGHGVEFNRKNKCMELSDTLRLVYYHHYFKANLKKFEEPRALVLGMLQNETKQFESAIKDARWIDVHTRATLLRKLKNIQEFVGYTDWLLDEDNVYRFYDMADAPNRGQPFLERLSYHRVQMYKKLIRELNASRKPETWPDIIAEITSAAYHQRDVNVKVHAGMLLKPFIFLHAPRYVNYGTVGFVAGHEIIHAFDDRGTTIDEHGVNFEQDPWPNSTRQEFLKRMKSVIDFYTDEFQINGSYTRNENLADMTAIRSSFRAYKDNLNSEMEPALPGLQAYSNDQLYFLSFASIWCNNNKYDNTSIHGPHSSRVNGPLMNLQEFSDAYKCPLGSRMNPEEKIIFWG